MRHSLSLLALIASCTMCTKPEKITAPPIYQVPHLVDYAKPIQQFYYLMYNAVQRKPESEGGLEFAACQFGSVKPDGTVVVNRTRVPHMTKQTYHSLDYNDQPCADEPDFVGAAHSHPDFDGRYTCNPSDVDVRTFEKKKRWHIMTLVCNDSTQHNGVLLKTYFRKDLPGLLKQYALEDSIQ